MTTPAPRISVVIPAYNEAEGIGLVLGRIIETVTLPCEVLVVVDSLDDSTIPALAGYRDRTQPTIRALVNDYGRGPAHAIRYGFDHASAPVVVVTMADGSDDARQIDEMARLVERGVVVVAASRYMPAGQQVGGPAVKQLLSRTAGLTLYWFAHIGTRDATNSFKAYSRAFVQLAGIDSRDGFEIGLELTAKARRMRQPVAEIPTIWLDRTAGRSNFKLVKWVPKYLHWYRFAFGPRLELGRSDHNCADVEPQSSLKVPGKVL